jgi:hypothetical protein
LLGGREEGRLDVGLLAAARVPPAVFAAALARPAPADPAALRSALAGLRHMLRHPLTHAFDPAERALLLGPSHDAANALGLRAHGPGTAGRLAGKSGAAAPRGRLDRPTAAARAKALPRRKEPFEAKALPLELAPAPHAAEFALATAGSAGTRRGTAGAAIGAGRGVPSTNGLAAALGRRAAAARMLETIEADLDAMYQNRNDGPSEADAT